MNNLLTKALLAFAGAALVSTSAYATTASATNGDLFIGFRQKNNTNDYLIDLGSITNFTTATGPIHFTLSLSDLTGLFGTNWNSANGDSTLFWGSATTTGLTAALGFPAKTVFASKAETTFGTQSSPFSLLASYSTPESKINGLYTGFNGATLSTSSMTAGLQAITQTASGSSSWSTLANTSNVSFSTWSNPTVEGAFTNGATQTALDLYEFPGNATSGNATYLGNFTIDNSANLTFTPAAAIPEPSSVVMLGIGAGALALVLRRQRHSFAA